MSLKERINLVKQQFGISEADTLNIEKALGKKLVDYESIEALVAALMGYYNPLIEGISETFKNFCPFKVGDIYLTTNSTNPSSIFLGTTWQKIEGKFLMGTSGSGASKATGGSNSRTIVQANLPNIKLAVDSFSLSRGTQNITGSADTWTYQSETISSGALYFSGTGKRNYNVNGGWSGTSLKLDASKTWTGSTNSVSPQTSTLGSGQALDITPSYYTCHMWLRLT